MKFIVAVPSCNESSGGCNVLMNLAKKLSEYGHDSKVLVMDKKYTSTIYTNYYTEDTIDNNIILIVPEGTYTLPLNTCITIRWILFGSDIYPTYNKNEIIYYFAPFCKNNPANKRLSLNYWPSGVENKNLVRTNESCYIGHKGMANPLICYMFTNNKLPLKGINLQGYSHKSIIEIFNNTKYFYCYDPCSFLVVMALMCGCIVIQYPIIGYSAEEWRYATNLIPSLNGISYGHDNLAHAEATIGYAATDYLKLKEENELTLQKFINDMETGNYTNEPCYPFNDSPFALAPKSLLLYEGDDPRINVLYNEILQSLTPQKFFGNLI